VTESIEKRKKKRKRRGGGLKENNQTMIRSNISKLFELASLHKSKESTYLTHTQHKNTYQHFFTLHNTEINAIKKDIKKYLKDILEHQPVYHPV
jgi:hypothetical protein